MPLFPLVPSPLLCEGLLVTLAVYLDTLASSPDSTPEAWFTVAAASSQIVRHKRLRE